MRAAWRRSWLNTTEKSSNSIGNSQATSTAPMRVIRTQQSLLSSVNFGYVNKILIPETRFNSSGMSQFCMRFIRYTSTE